MTAGARDAHAWKLVADNRAVSGVRGRDQFRAGACTLLASLLPADAVSWNAVDLASGTAEVFTADSTPGFDDDTVALLAEVAAEHPMVTTYLHGPGSATVERRRLSDVVSRTDLRRTRTYAELLEPSGTEYQLTIVTARQTAVGGRCWTLNRGTRDFDDEERDLAARLQPVLVALDIACDLVGSPTEHVVSDSGDIDLTRREVEVLGCDDRLVAVDRARRLGMLDRACPYVE